MIDVPDPDRNILHACAWDAMSPNALRTASGIRTTSGTSEEIARAYNDFMQKTRMERVKYLSTKKGFTLIEALIACFDVLMLFDII